MTSATSETTEVRMDRVIHMDVDGDDAGLGFRDRVEEMCRHLLANPVLEDFEVEVERMKTAVVVFPRQQLRARCGLRNRER